MREIPPVGEGYSHRIMDVIDPGIMLEGHDVGTNFGFESTEDLIRSFPRKAVVLDLGNAWGALDILAHKVRRDVNIVNINPGYVNSTVRHHSWHYPIRGIQLAAFNPNLPIRNNYFDVVVDSWASIHYGGRWDKKLERLIEILRVTKRYGHVYAGPIDDRLKNARLHDVLDIPRVKSCIPTTGFLDKYYFHIQKN